MAVDPFRDAIFIDAIDAPHIIENEEIHENEGLNIQENGLPDDGIQGENDDEYAEAVRLELENAELDGVDEHAPQLVELPRIVQIDWFAGAGTMNYFELKTYHLRTEAFWHFAPDHQMVIPMLDPSDVQEFSKIPSTPDLLELFRRVARQPPISLYFKSILADESIFLSPRIINELRNCYIIMRGYGVFLEKVWLNNEKFNETLAMAFSEQPQRQELVHRPIPISWPIDDNAYIPCKRAKLEEEEAVMRILANAQMDIQKEEDENKNGVDDENTPSTSTAHAPRSHLVQPHPRVIAALAALHEANTAPSWKDQQQLDAAKALQQMKVESPPTNDEEEARRREQEQKDKLYCNEVLDDSFEEKAEEHVFRVPHLPVKYRNRKLTPAPAKVLPPSPPKKILRNVFEELVAPTSSKRTDELSLRNHRNIPISPLACPNGFNKEDRVFVPRLNLGGSSTYKTSSTTDCMETPPVSPDSDDGENNNNNENNNEDVYKNNRNLNRHLSEKQMRMESKKRIANALMGLPTIKRVPFEPLKHLEIDEQDDIDTNDYQHFVSRVQCVPMRHIKYELLDGSNDPSPYRKDEFVIDIEDNEEKVDQRPYADNFTVHKEYEKDFSTRAQKQRHFLNCAAQRKRTRLSYQQPNDKVERVSSFHHVSLLMFNNTIKNSGTQCYAIAAVQIMLRIPQIWSMFERHSHKNYFHRSGCFSCHIQNFIASNMLYAIPSVYIVPCIQPFWNEVTATTQHDVNEAISVFSRIMDSNRTAELEYDKEEIISGLFQYGIVTKKTCRNCGHTKTSKEKDSAIKIVVDRCYDKPLSMEMAFETYFKGVIEDYTCDECHQKTSIDIVNKMSSMPEVLHLTINRADVRLGKLPFPLYFTRMVNMGEYYCGPENEDADPNTPGTSDSEQKKVETTYLLAGYSCHFGAGHQSGHYTAVVRDFSNMQEMILCNDAAIYDMPTGSFDDKKTVCALVYRKQSHCEWSYEQSDLSHDAEMLERLTRAQEYMKISKKKLYAGNQLMADFQITLPPYATYMTDNCFVKIVLESIEAKWQMEMNPPPPDDDDKKKPDVKSKAEIMKQIDEKEKLLLNFKPRRLFGSPTNNNNADVELPHLYQEDDQCTSVGNEENVEGPDDLTVSPRERENDENFAQSDTDEEDYEVVDEAYFVVSEN